MPVSFASARVGSRARRGRATTLTLGSGVRPPSELRWRVDRESDTVLAFITLGFKEIVMIGMVVLALYGRSGSRLIRATKYGRTVDPWLNLVRVRPRADDPRRRAQSPSVPRKRQGRVFWALALTAAAAVAAWVATRVMVLSGSGVSH